MHNADFCPPRSWRACDLKISIIIPALNEAQNIGRLIGLLGSERERTEIVVVDGGSADDTPSVARAAGAEVIITPPGRGHQMACGAEQTDGDVLLFLHADSQLKPEGLRAIRTALTASPEAIGGNFRLLFDGHDGFSLWLNRFYAWLRSRGLYYGDSGIFLLRTEYVRLGGMRPIALMEDFDLVRRMERTGRTLCIQDPPLMTSSRRFRGRKPVAIVLGWCVIHLLYLIGVSPDRLAHLYRSAVPR